MIKKVMILSGGFDPLHSGHIDLFENAKKVSDYVIVCLNSDDWLRKKKGINFLDFDERKRILLSNKFVDDVISFEDDEFGSAVNGLEKVLSLKDTYRNILSDKTYNSEGDIVCNELCDVSFYFVNGGDRNSISTPTKEQQF